MEYISKRNTYPKVALPTFYKTIKDKTFNFKDFYPNFNIPNLPEKPNKEIDYPKEFFGILVLIFGVGFILSVPFGIIGSIIYSSFFSDSMTEPQFWKQNVGFAVILILIIAITFYYYGFKKERKLIDMKSEIYDRDVILRKTQLEKKKELELSIITNNLAFVERKKNLINKLNSLKLNIIKDSIILDDNEIKKGVSEEFFYKILNKYSNYKVYKSLKYGFYFPDLVIVKDNLVAVLEIDEPYSFENKEPIHYDDMDENRDIFFVDNGFLVIRFAEDQILSEPLKCVKILDDIYGMVLNFGEYSNLKKINKIELPSWSYQTGFDLAYNNSRNKNLNKIRKLEKDLLN
jgi:very-short-patch-repair endonuclease